jgi:hypothetical protein
MTLGHVRAIMHIHIQNPKREREIGLEENKQNPEAKTSNWIKTTVFFFFYEEQTGAHLWALHSYSTLMSF